MNQCWARHYWRNVCTFILNHKMAVCCGWYIIITQAKSWVNSKNKILMCLCTKEDSIIKLLIRTNKNWWLRLCFNISYKLTIWIVWMCCQHYCVTIISFHFAEKAYSSTMFVIWDLWFITRKCSRATCPQFMEITGPLSYLEQVTGGQTWKS